MAKVQRDTGKIQPKERDPEATRRRLIDTAIKLLASDNAGAFSVSEVARAAKVNRGTAYIHFGSRDKLVAAAIEHVSQQISSRLYDNMDRGRTRGGFDPDRIEILEDMALFLIRNPEFSRIWLFEVLAKQGNFSDPLTMNVRKSIERFSKSRFGADDIDAEVYTLIIFGAYFLWPLLIKSRHLPEQEQRTMASRVVTEILRLSLFGSIRADMSPDLVRVIKARIDDRR